MDDNGGFASCESCGMKFSRDTVKRMIIELCGPVQVEGIANIDNLLARAKEYENSGDIKKAFDYYNRILDLDVNNFEAKQRYNVLKPASVGDIIEVEVVRIKEFGAIAQLPNGSEGLIHISRLDIKRVECVEDVVKVGDVFDAKVLLIGPDGKISLSRAAAMPNRY